MSNVSDFYQQAELALAAYSNLTTGISGEAFISALEDGGRNMATNQAETFASTYTVLTQHNGTGNGLSAVDIGARRYRCQSRINF